jgi:hypothetical protein
VYACVGGHLRVTTYAAGSDCTRLIHRSPVSEVCLSDTSRMNQGSASLPGVEEDSMAREAAAAVHNTVKLLAFQHARSPHIMPMPKAPTRSPAVAPVTDDVNYYDQDDVDDQTFEYDDYVYVYAHDDQDFGNQTQTYGGGDDDDTFDPPPSMSTTAFPTTAAEAHSPVSRQLYCQAAPKKRSAVFTAVQVRLAGTLMMCM